MSEVCVCGHEEICHDEMNYHAFCEPEGKVKCDCCDFRACLDWPDAKGLWYCDNGSVYEINAKLEIYDSWECRTQDHATLYEDWMDRVKWESENMPAKFTKCEPNPFRGA